MNASIEAPLAVDGAARLYLERLERALRPLPPTERDAVGAEIRSHIAERSAAPDAPIAAILAALGEPEDLARAYLEDHEMAAALHRASPGRLLASILGRATRSLTALAVGLTAVILYALGLSFALVAIMKPIAPANVGLWRGPGSFSMGFLASPGPSTSELLGLWIVPLGLIAAVICYLAATALIKRGGRILLRRSTAKRPSRSFGV
jgi:uncharacterized membrane protein